MPER